MKIKITVATGLLLACTGAPAEVTRALPYPGDSPSADQVADNVFFANHFYAFKNFMIKRRGRTMTVLINRSPNGKMTTTAVERYLNNNYKDGPIKGRDLAIFRSGKLKGTGLLVTDYVDETKPQSYMLWLPSLRKVRRFAEPAHDDAWGGSVFTYGDVTLRKPSHETHQLLGKQTFKGCLGSIRELAGERFKYAGELPEGACRHKGKEVYLLKSTSRFENWWYDHRISFVDTRSFADYRTAFYKDGKMIKVIDRDWGRIKGSGVKDPRALFWKYWYGRDIVSGRETWAVIPEDIVGFNERRRASYWSEKTLRKLKR